MNVLMRLMIGALKIAATMWVFMTVRRYFGTIAVMTEVGRRVAGAFGWSRAFSLLTALNALKSRPQPVEVKAVPHTPTNPS